MRTTRNHFEIFRAECQRLARLWRISGWSLQYAHRPLKDERIAETLVMNPERQILLSLTTRVPYKLSARDIRAAARHEMIHVLLEPLQSVEQLTEGHDAVKSAATHEVLRRLMELLP